MEIQIKGIWYNVPDFDEFYNTIEVGDIVTLVLEPENICESEAIAVYYRYKRIGYVNTNELSAVHNVMGNNNKLKVVISNKCIDEDPKLNYLAFVLNDATESDLICWKDCKHFTFQNLLGDVKISTLVESEVCLELIIDDFIEAMDIALSRDDNSLITEGAVLETIELSKLYIENCTKSLSGQCTLSMDPICKRLRIMEKRYPKYSQEFHSLHNTIWKIERKFSNEQFVESIFDNQMELFIKECSRKGGFFTQYYDAYLKHVEENKLREMVCGKIQEIRDWILNLPEGIGLYFFNNKRQFCMKLRYLKFGYKNLYEVYTNLALMAYLIDMKESCPQNDEYANSSMIAQSIMLIQKNDVHYHTEHVDKADNVHVHGDAEFKSDGDMNIDKVIKNNGTIQ